MKDIGGTFLLVSKQICEGYFLKAEEGHFDYYNGGHPLPWKKCRIWPYSAFSYIRVSVSVFVSLDYFHL